MLKATALALAVGISLLFVFSAVAVQPVHATATTGLYAAFWYGSFYGTPLPAVGYPSGCVSESSWPAGSASFASTPPTATEIDPNIAHGASANNFEWVETSPGFTVGSTTFYQVEFSVEWTGYITLSAGTTYYFQLESDDGSQLYINTASGSSTISSGNLVINNANTNPTGYGPGIQPPTTATSGPITVKSTGSYPIEVDYYETCDTQSGIDLSWATGSPSGFSIIPSTLPSGLPVFTPAQIGSNAPSLPPPSVPEFGFAAPVVAAVGLLALVLMRRTIFGRIDTTAGHQK